MKIKSVVLNGLLSVALATAMCACGNSADNANGESEVAVNSKAGSKLKENTGKSLKIAFVEIDTLTNQYQLYKDASDEFEKKQANAESTINAKGKTFAAQVQEFQRKAQANQFTQEAYEREQARLQKLQQDIQDLQGRLSNSLQEEYQTQVQAITDTIKSFMKVYAKEKGFDYILCKSSGIDNVLYADEGYDVTNEVVAALNKRYGKKESK